MEVIKTYAGEIPILGVCLGHQSIGQVFGGRVVRAPRVMHGKTSKMFHDEKGLFAGVENPFVATRYHSLVIAPESLPDGLEVTAKTWEDEIMGVRAPGLARPLEGVQFHPESIMTTSASRSSATSCGWRRRDLGDRARDRARGRQARLVARRDGRGDRLHHGWPRDAGADRRPARRAARQGRDGRRAGRRGERDARARDADRDRASRALDRHLRHRRRRLGHDQHLDARRDPGRRVRRRGRQARQPRALEQVRLGRRARGARQSRSIASPRCRAHDPRGRHRLHVRAAVPQRDAPRRRAAPRARHPHDLQPARAADQPGPGSPPGRRGLRSPVVRGRSPPRWARSACAGPRSSTARVASTRSRCVARPTSRCGTRTTTSSTR